MVVAPPLLHAATWSASISFIGYEIILHQFFHLCLQLLRIIGIVVETLIKFTPFQPLHFGVHFIETAFYPFNDGVEVGLNLVDA